MDGPCATTLRYHMETIKTINEREEFMQETQHTQQTATRTAQNQDKTKIIVKNVTAPTETGQMCSKIAM